MRLSRMMVVVLCIGVVGCGGVGRRPRWDVTFSVEWSERISPVEKVGAKVEWKRSDPGPVLGVVDKSR